MRALCREGERASRRRLDREGCTISTWTTRALASLLAVDVVASSPHRLDASRDDNSAAPSERANEIVADLHGQLAFALPRAHSLCVRAPGKGSNSDVGRSGGEGSEKSAAVSAPPLRKRLDRKTWLCSSVQSRHPARRLRA